MARDTPIPAFVALLIALLGAAAVVWAARQAADVLLDRLRPPPPVAVQIQAPSSVQVDEARAQRERQARMQAEQEAIAAEKARREAQRTAVLQAREAAISAEREEEARKQAAWERFYRRPKKCESPPDNATLVECSNHYLREQQRFEKQYVANQP